MSDNYGAVPVPLTPTIDTPGAVATAVQDPFLTQTLAFLKAWLDLDGGAKAAWDAKGVAPGHPVINGMFPYSPSARDHLFSEKDLPALFLWREDSSDEWIADDWEVETTQVKLLWVWPIAVAVTQGTREPFLNGLAKAIKIGLERGRTPSYQIPNDPDFQHGQYGSLFYTFAGIMSLFVTKHRPAELALEMQTEHGQRPGPSRKYRGLECTLELKELMEYDIARFAAVTGLGDVTITINGGPQQVEGRP